MSVSDVLSTPQTVASVENEFHSRLTPRRRGRKRNSKGTHEPTTTKSGNEQTPTFENLPKNVNLDTTNDFNDVNKGLCSSGDRVQHTIDVKCEENKLTASQMTAFNDPYHPTITPSE